MKIDFNNYESYIAWRAEWRLQWHEIVKNIRETKRNRKQDADNVVAHAFAQYRRQELRGKARYLHEVRVASKIQAGIQRAACLKNKAA